MIVCKNFKVMMTKSVGSTVPNASQESAHNHMILQMFYDDRWGPAPRDMILWFKGGSGHGLEDSSYARVQYVLSKGFVYINCSTFAPQHHPMDFKLEPTMPIHDYVRYAFEVESFLEHIYENVIYDKDAKRHINQDSKVVLTGTSRGAGIILQWSCLTRGIYAAYSQKVIGLVANSPAGGNNSRRWNGPYIAQRATYKYYQNVRHPTIACIGAGDITHTNRAHMERIYRHLSNQLVKIVVEGDDTWDHTWPNLSRDQAYQKFFNHAFNFFYAL